MNVPFEILAVARQLGELRERVVFLGGMVRGILITDPAVEGPRQTLDVDVIVDAPDLHGFSQTETELRARGFRNDMTEDAPICRMVLPGANRSGGNLPVDFMPLDPVVLGFSNVWYPNAYARAQRLETSEGSIRVIDAPHFLATKLESFNSRGNGEYFHHDLEDVVVLVDGRPELIAELRAAPAEVRSFVATEVAILLASSAFRDNLPWHLSPDAASQARLPLLTTRLEVIAGLVTASDR